MNMTEIISIVNFILILIFVIIVITKTIKQNKKQKVYNDRMDMIISKLDRMINMLKNKNYNPYEF